MSKKKKIEAEEKEQIVIACAKGAISAYTAAEQMSVHPTVIYDWMQQHQTEGIAVFLPQRGKRHYDPVLKIEAVKDYIAGK